MIKKEMIKMKNNIFTISKYNKSDLYGILVDTKDIFVQVYDYLDYFKEDEQYLQNYSNNIECIEIPDGTKYIYLLEAYLADKAYGRFVNESNINISYHLSEEEAILSGIETMKQDIINDFIRLENPDEEDISDLTCNLIEDEHFYNYEFTIYKILVNRHIFKSLDERNKYYHDNLSNQKTKEDLNDFLIDIMGGYQINKYSLTGELRHSTVVFNHRTINNLSMKSLLGYHVEKFNIGDVVKILNDPYYKDELFIIKYKYSNNYSIYESDDPLHYREGYMLYRKDDEDCRVINDYYDDLYYDEDLELVETNTKDIIKEDILSKQE